MAAVIKYYEYNLAVLKVSNLKWVLLGAKIKVSVKLHSF
jgi:hypothetical protein